MNVRSLVVGVGTQVAAFNICDFVIIGHWNRRFLSCHKLFCEFGARRPAIFGRSLVMYSFVIQAYWCVFLAFVVMDVVLVFVCFVGLDGLSVFGLCCSVSSVHNVVIHLILCVHFIGCFMETFSVSSLYFYVCYFSVLSFVVIISFDVQWRT